MWLTSSSLPSGNCGTIACQAEGGKARVTTARRSDGRCGRGYCFAVACCCLLLMLLLLLLCFCPPDSAFSQVRCVVVRRHWPFESCRFVCLSFLSLSSLAHFVVCSGLPSQLVDPDRLAEEKRKVSARLVSLVPSPSLHPFL